MSEPRIPDLQTLWQAGINPKTGLPMKFGSSKCMLKEDIKKALRIQDEQDAVNRYVWYNLPANITSQELERMLYYKGQLCFFYDKDLEEFYFMPYALDGTIDFYGRFNTIHPVPMTSGTDDKGSKAQAQYLADKKLKCIYGIDFEGKADPLTSTVLLHDYTKQLSQTIIPRCSVNEPVLDMMSEVLPMARTNMIASCGVKGVRVQDADQQQNVADGSRSLMNASLTGDPWVPIIGNIDFQELTDNATGKNQDYFLALQSLDNFRLSLYGIDNGGLFEKKAHELQSEADINGGPVGLVMQDGLSIRQNFANIVNSI
ncbi:MAG: hypothetical protein IKN46_01630 [Acholeplasmatales bacterium]|nr:hypothetical protein [Acholeplasmatales bacterium]